jgi:hypothetical protein
VSELTKPRYVAAYFVQALRDNTPDQWSSLSDLQQKRDDYYAELKAPHREILGESQV